MRVSSTAAPPPNRRGAPANDSSSAVAAAAAAASQHRLQRIDVDADDAADRRRTAAPRKRTADAAGRREAKRVEADGAADAGVDAAMDTRGADDGEAARRYEFPIYVANWHALIDVVLAHDAALFPRDELAALRALRGLDADAQSLVMRLVGRQGRWLREAALDYDFCSAALLARVVDLGMGERFAARRLFGVDGADADAADAEPEASVAPSDAAAAACVPPLSALLGPLCVAVPSGEASEASEKDGAEESEAGRSKTVETRQVERKGGLKRVAPTIDDEQAERENKAERKDDVKSVESAKQRKTPPKTRATEASDSVKLERTPSVATALRSPPPTPTLSSASATARTSRLRLVRRTPAPAEPVVIADDDGGDGVLASPAPAQRAPPPSPAAVSDDVMCLGAAEPTRATPTPSPNLASPRPTTLMQFFARTPSSATQTPQRTESPPAQTTAATPLSPAASTASSPVSALRSTVLQATLARVLDSYTSAHLQSVCKRLALASQVPSGKPALLALVCAAPFRLRSPEAQLAQAERILSHLAGIGSPLFRLAPVVRGALQRTHRLFFLHDSCFDDQPATLDVFVLSHVQKLRFPTYAVDVQHPIWASFGALAQFERAVRAMHVFSQACHDGDWVRAEHVAELASRALFDADRPGSLAPGLLPVLFPRYSATSVLARICSESIQSVLERRKAYDLAIQRCRALIGIDALARKRGHWWDRLSLCLLHTNRKAEALQACEAALRDESVVHGHRRGILKRYLRLARPPLCDAPAPFECPSDDWSAIEIQLSGLLLRKQVGLKSLFEGTDGPCIVEELCLQYFRSIGFQGLHCEGSVLRTLFGLTLWDAIFAPVPDVFRHAFQDGPLDFGTDAFYSRRRDLVDSILAPLEADDQATATRQLVEVLGTRIRELHGTRCPCVDWSSIHVAHLLSIVNAAGARALCALFRPLATNYRQWCSGLPDLLIWRAGEMQLVEVKGPNDRLSEKQCCWLQHLTQAGVVVRVCRVSTSKARPAWLEAAMRSAH